MNHIITLPTVKKKEVVNLTDRIEKLLNSQEKTEGVCTIFVIHSTAAITTGEIGEGTEEDFLEIAEKIVPHISFRHEHNPAHAWSHMISSLIGASLSVPFKDKKLMLGAWQSVLLMEFDGPRERTVVVSI